MLLKIDAYSTSYIFINVPAEKAKFLEQTVKLFEENALFVSGGHDDFKQVKPEISAILKGSEYLKSWNGVEAQITDKDCVIEDFEKATPEFYISFGKFKKDKESEIEQLKREISILKGRLEAYESKDDSED